MEGNTYSLNAVPLQCTTTAETLVMHCTINLFLFLVCLPNTPVRHLPGLIVRRQNTRINLRRGLCLFRGYVENADMQGKYTSVLGTDSNVPSDVKR